MPDTDRREWTEDDFDSLSWHDNELHGIRLHNPENGFRFDLILDIDHILNWHLQPEGFFLFSLAPALLTFYDVTKLECHFMLTYKEHISISRIAREALPSSAENDPHRHFWRWFVHLQPDVSPAAIITVEAAGFTQRLTKSPIVTSRQSLADHER